MATRKNKDDLVKVTLNLVEADWTFLKEIYPKTGAGHAVRKIVASHVEAVKKRIQEKQARLEPVELEGEL